MRIDWSQRPVSDLSALYDSIAQDSPLYAERFVATLIRATDPLVDFPELGRRVPEEPDRENVRELLVRTYRIIYRIDADRVLIATVLHDSRDVDRLEDKPWKAP